MEDKNLEGFLKQGKLQDVLCWNEQIKFFISMLVFVLPQFVVAYVSGNFVQVSMIPCICMVLEIIMLILCRMKADKPYGHNYCFAMHLLIMSMLLFVDSMLCLYHLVNRKYYVCWVIGSVMIYCICIFGRYFWVSRKIARGGYKDLEGINYNYTLIASIMGPIGGIIIPLILRRFAPYISQKKSITIFFSCLVILCLMAVKFVDYFMMYYCFTKLSEEEQRYICGEKKIKKVEKKSVYEVIGKK